MCRLSTWGLNEHAELGNGGKGDPEFKPASISLELESVSAGLHFACGIDSTQLIRCWGRNDLGQLGHGKSWQYVTEPVAIPTLRGAHMISAGAYHACAIVTEPVMRAYCWGSGNSGRLGNADTEDYNVPVAVRASDQYIVSAGYDHTCGIDARGDLQCWGNNSNEQLGFEKGSFHFSDTYATPQTLGKRNSEPWAAVSAGFESTCGLSGKSAYCWGNGERGNIGSNSRPSKAGITKVVMDHDTTGGSSFVTIQTRHFTTCGITQAQKLYCWGAASNGEVGDGSTVNRFKPVPVAQTLNFVSLSLGEQHACATTSHGALYCWGGNSAGQVGTGAKKEKQYLTPQRVLDFCPAVVAGYRSTYALCTMADPPPTEDNMIENFK